MNYQRAMWSAEVERGLANTFVDMPPEEVRELVTRGQVVILKASNGSFVAYERQPDCVYLWAYEGAAAADALEDMRAMFAPLPIRARTYHKGLTRLLRKCAPRVLRTFKGMSGLLTEFEVSA